MSANKTTIIKEKIEIPRFRLWIIWLLLFVFPSFITIIAFNSFNEKYKYFSKTDLIANSFEEIKRYNFLIVPENFMEEQLNKVKRLNATLPAKDLKNKIDEMLCGESLFCFFFDKAIDETINIKSSKCDKILKNIPNTFIKRNLKNILDNSALENDTIKNSKALKNDIVKFGNILQNLFKSITPITIIPNKISKNFSVLCGGELYFVLCLFDNPAKNNFGFFAVIRGREFSFHKMLERLHKSFPEIRIIFKDLDVEKTYYNQEKLYSGIKHTSKGPYIISPTDLKFSRHVLHGGSESLIEGYGHLMPFIEYRIPTERYNEKAYRNNKIISFTALILIIISGIYFLNISLFGFKDKFSFKSKIMILALTAAIFPFSVFTIGIYIIENYNRFIEKTAIQQHAETEIQLATQELEEYLTEIEATVSETGTQISKLLSNQDLKPSALLEYLDKIGKEIPASLEILYLKPMLKNLEIISFKNKIIKKFPERISESILNEEEDSLSNLLPSTLMKALADEESKKNKERLDKLEIGNEKINSAFIDDALQNVGNITKLDHFINPIWYIIKQLNNTEESNNSVIGIYVVKFEPSPIINSFINNSTIKKKKNFKEIIGNYTINYAFIPTEKSGNVKIWSGSGNISDKDKELCLTKTQTGLINLGNKIIIIKKNQHIPHLAVATITEKQTNTYIYFIIILVIIVLGYLSLILIFASKLLDIMFVEPVMLLASNANAIARGSEKWDVEINSGDEFEDLNNEFKHLVTGLQERNILKSYVSEDAFSDIEETESLKLLPSGEYLEASIVFSAIIDYDKLSSSITPQDSIKLLSNFMSIAEEVSKKYGGSIDKIIGDTIMLVFRENHFKDSHGLRAAQASLELVKKAKAVNMPKLYTGIASGRVISGRIGSYSGKLDFTVIGNPVNLAARFKTESKNGTEDTGIIISGTTIGLMNGKANVKFLRRVSIKGKTRKYNIYELLGIRD